MAETKVQDAAKIAALLDVVLKTVPLPNLRAVHQAAMEELAEVNATLEKAQAEAAEEAKKKAAEEAAAKAKEAKEKEAKEKEAA
jgi:hypothetical protein